MNIKIDALEAAQRSFLEQYDRQVGYEYRAAYRRGYSYLWVRLHPTTTGVILQFTHSNKLCEQITAHLRMYHVDEETVEKIREKMNND